MLPTKQSGFHVTAVSIHGMSNLLTLHTRGIKSGAFTSALQNHPSSHTTNTSSLVTNLLSLKIVIRSGLLINIISFIMIEKAFYIGPRKNIIVVST